jgi:hypothetical protein
MRTKEEVIHAFTYHKPRNDVEVMFYETYREKVKQNALVLMDFVPECAERTLALRHLEQAVMYANAAVARNGMMVSIEKELTG